MYLKFQFYSHNYIYRFKFVYFYILMCLYICVLIFQWIVCCYYNTNSVSLTFCYVQVVKHFVVQQSLIYIQYFYALLLNFNLMQFKNYTIKNNIHKNTSLILLYLHSKFSKVIFFFVLRLHGSFLCRDCVFFATY